MKVWPVALVAALVLVACDSGSAAETSTRATVSVTTSASVPPATTSARSTTTTPPASTTTAPLQPCFDSEPVQPEGSVLFFYAQCAFGELQPVYRVADQPPSLQEGLEAMVAGVTPEEEELGLATGFDFVDDAEQIKVEVAVGEDGFTTIDFRIGDERWHPGSLAGTSAQLFSFFDPINAVVFSYPQVTELDRSTLCWGESGCRGVTTPAEWETSLFLNSGVLLHGGCTHELAFWYPALCTLEGVLSRSTQLAAVVGVADDDVLNVRAGPGAGYLKMDQLAPGADVGVTSIAAADDGAEWWLTALGWVNARFLEGPQVCDPTPIVAFADEALAAARLGGDAAWDDTVGDSKFGPRTTDADTFARVLGFDCHWEATQQVDGDERLAIAAWSGDRVSLVIQAADAPADGYAQDRTVDVLIDAPRGEMIGNDTWATQLPAGDTLILATKNTTNLGWVAKSWLTEYAFAPGDYPTESDAWTDTERMAIPILRGVGGRNVSVGEPSHGSQVTWITAASPLGDELSVTVGPSQQLTPWDYEPGAKVFSQTLEDTVVRLIDPAQEFPASSASFVCNGYQWIIEASTGPVPELLNFTQDLIAVLGCK